MTLSPVRDRKMTTANVVADALRSAILDGSLKSSQPLRQDEIASQLGVSKIPVREALVQLQSEGLVTFQPSRGASVSSLSSAEVEEIYAMRIALETLVLRKAIPNQTEADFIKAEHLLTLIDTEEAPMTWGKQNWAFHDTLYLPANMPMLMNTLRILSVNVARYFVIYQAMSYRKVSQSQHRDILAACREGDSDSACFYLENHLRSAAKNMVAFLKEQENT